MPNIADPAAAVDWGFLISMAFGLIVFLYRKFRRVEDAFLSLEQMQEREFGGNGGGLREALNNLDAKLDSMHEDLRAQSRRITDVESQVSHLRGRFEQHLHDTTGDR